MKYARTERERRFLLQRLPEGLPTEYRRIRDWYLDGTRLRLRRVEDGDGKVLDLKLGQKYTHGAPGAGWSTTITNLYLSEAEFELLRTLGGRPITKRRQPYLHGQQQYSIDVFEQELAGLLVAEIELDSHLAAASLPTPEFAIADVTGELCFTGGALARTTAQQLQQELARWGAA